MLAIALTGCSGDDGSQGPPGPPGTNVGVATLSEATSLTINITSVTINSAPVVNFTVKNQDGVPVSGFGAADLRFNIAKLVPGTSGGPSKWQNYINRVSSGAVQGTQERASTGGTLVDNKNGTFTYTFAADITNPAANPCPAPCTDADGNALDISYQPSLVHRVTIQQGNSAYPQYNATYTFVPGGGEVASGREIVQTATCNQCHNKISAHGSRIETKLCVTCHNPGSWVKGTPNVPVDFKVMIHKIHQGEELPSVIAGVPYKIGNADFSDVVFPYSAVALGDTRACTKCHDGTAAQADNWKNQPSKAACSACHDDVYFGASPDPLKLYQTVSHATLSGIADPADSTCTLCHGVGKPEDVVVKHDLPNLLKAEGAKYQFKVESTANTAPSAPGGAAIQVVFSVKNPATGTAYNIKTDPAFACVPGTGLPASVSMLVGWNNTDENNTGSASNPGQPYSASVLDTYSAGVCSDNANVAGPDGSGNFTLTLAGKVIPLVITGSGRAALYGRITKDVDGNGTKENVRIKAVYKDFAITDTTPVARRTVVDIAKCDKCHDSLSLHGDARTDEPGLCVICHNPSATDVNRRPKGAGTGGLFPDATLSLDGKAEEAIDFKRLIHGVHAAAKTDYTGAAAEGFRNKGLVIYGFNSSVNDFSHVRFPGILNDCLTCHVTPTGNNRGSYELAGKWEVPTASGILGSTISTVPDLTGVYATQLADQTDDLNITPTAAVCSSCHDSATAKSHMQLNGALFAATQAVINTGVTLEACAICHGPGRLADLKVVHGIQ
jgi:OmcA/MtrC family decaheme c-type cytochrome